MNLLQLMAKCKEMLGEELVKSERLEKARWLGSNYIPEPKDKGLENKERPGQIGHIDKLGNPVWTQSPNTIANHVQRIQDHFHDLPLKDENKVKLANLIRHIHNDPDKGVVSSGTTRGYKGDFNEIRMRHLGNAISGAKGYGISEDDHGVKIHADRHSGNKKNAGQSTSWHFDGKTLKSFQKDPKSGMIAEGSYDYGQADDSKPGKLGKSESRYEEFIEFLRRATAVPYGCSSRSNNRGHDLELGRDESRRAKGDGTRFQISNNDASGVRGGLQKTSLGHGYARLASPELLDFILKNDKLRKSIKSQRLEKDAGQIKAPHLNSKFTRPEQQVKRVTGGDEYQKAKSANTEQSTQMGITKPANQRIQPHGGELVMDQRRGSYKPSYAIVGKKASRGIEQHEGFHALSDHLTKKHGVDKIHGMYSKLIAGLHPGVNEYLDGVLSNFSNYSKMAKQPDKKWQTKYMEEKINLLHDLVHQGKDADPAAGTNRRSSAIHADQQYPEDLKDLGFKDFRHFDNTAKHHWKKLRDKANAVKPEDL